MAEEVDATGASRATQVADLFDRHAPALLRYAIARLGPAAAEDVVSETFLVAVRDLAGYDAARGSQQAWLFGISTNLLRRHHRTEGRHSRLAALMAGSLILVTDEEPALISRLDAQARVRQLSKAIDDLAEVDREVLLLTALGELTATEVAAVLSIPAGTVRSRLHRARQHLRLAATNLDETGSANGAVVPLTPRLEGQPCLTQP